MDNDKPSMEELRTKLRARIGEKKIQRSNKVEKEKVVEKTFKELGVDVKEFKDAMKILNKSNPLQRQQILKSKMDSVTDSKK
jgi:hypothetical protein